MTASAQRTIGQRIYSLLFKVFGPAQLGDANGPSNPLPVRDEACSLCGQPTAAHTVERSPEISRLRCPAPGA
jgi:hypothetical protein